MKINLEFWKSVYKIRYIPGIKDSTTKKEIKFIVKFLPKRKYKTILDFMCGYGRHSIALGRLGYFVVGFDIDQQSIIKARRRAQKLNLNNIKLSIKNARDFQKKEKFDAAICIYSTIGAFNQKLNNILFQNLFNSIKPGGRLILDILNPEWAIKHICLYKEKKILFKKNKYFVKHFRKILYNPLREYNKIEIVYPMKKIAIYDLQLYSLEEIKKMLKVYHFKLFKCFGSFSGNRISSDNQRIIIIADKL